MGPVGWGSVYGCALIFFSGYVGWFVYSLICLCVHVCHNLHGKVRGHLAGFGGSFHRAVQIQFKLSGCMANTSAGHLPGLYIPIIIKF